MTKPTSKPKRKIGRPTTLTPKRQETLLRLVSTGKTFREAPPTTLPKVPGTKAKPEKAATSNRKAGPQAKKKGKK